MEAFKGISKSPFALWIVKEVKSKPVLDKFDGKFDPVSHLLLFKQIILLEEVNEGLMCKLFSMTFTGRALSWSANFLKDQYKILSNLA